MKQIDIKNLCDVHDLFFEKSNQMSHPYCIFLNSKSGSKEIYCRNLAECLVAIDELIAIRKAEGK